MPRALSLMKSLALLPILALMLAAPALAADPKPNAKPDLAKGQAISTQVCAACHAVDGSRGAPTNPILAAQHAEYLIGQLVEFKVGGRENPIMKAFAMALSEDDMRNVAAFYATKQSKPGFARNKELVAQGEKIYRGGIAEKSVPACAGCHSPTGAGIPSEYPRLAGQHAEYTGSQLMAFRDGTRKNNAPMMAIAARLSDREIKAVADYIAGLR